MNNTLSTQPLLLLNYPLSITKPSRSLAAPNFNEVEPGQDDHKEYILVSNVKYV